MLEKIQETIDQQSKALNQAKRIIQDQQREIKNINEDLQQNHLEIKRKISNINDQVKQIQTEQELKDKIREEI